MKLKYLKLKNWILITLLGALGVAGCRSQKDTVKEEKPRPDRQERDDRVMCLYGVPEVLYNDKPVVDEPVEEPKVEPRDQTPLMYGVPTINFKVKGKVVDENGKPVKGMQVVLLNGDIDETNLQEANPNYLQQYFERAGDTTQADGSFKVETRDRPRNHQHILVRDIDGKKHGEYKEDVVPVKFDMSKSSNNRTGTVEEEITVTVVKK